MSSDDVATEVNRFFAIVGYAGLVLPNGWFGRPFDNLLQLSRSEASKESLGIELDGQLTLTFFGEPRVASHGKGLSLTCFTLLTWDWTEFGSTVSHREEFTSGEVTFVPPLG